MGVTIHYTGKLKTIDLIDELMDELIEISKANEWGYQVVDAPLSPDMEDAEIMPDLQGIICGVKDLEPLWMTFNQEGKLLSPMAAMISVNDPEQYADLKYTCFIKTQYGGPDHHIKIVNLLKYLFQKYFDNWDVIDESGYFNSGNQEDLIQCMSIIDRSMAALNDAFEAHGDSLDGKSEEEIADFIGSVLGKDATEIQVIKFDEDEEE